MERDRQLHTFASLSVFLCVSVCVSQHGVIAFVPSNKSERLFFSSKETNGCADCSSNESENERLCVDYFERAKKTTAKHYIIEIYEKDAVAISRQRRRIYTFIAIVS